MSFVAEECRVAALLFKLNIAVVVVLIFNIIKELLDVIAALEVNTGRDYLGEVTAGVKKSTSLWVKSSTSFAHVPRYLATLLATGSHPLAVTSAPVTDIFRTSESFFGIPRAGS